jgi:hypothetical protein
MTSLSCVRVPFYVFVQHICDSMIDALAFAFVLHFVCFST